MDELAHWFSCCRDNDMVLCFNELWVKPNSPPVDVPGFQLFMSLIYRHPDVKCFTSYLPGSHIYISNTLSVERNSFCTDVEDSCKLLNVTCCILSCKRTKVAIVSVYRSPSICSNNYLTEIIDIFTQVLNITSNAIIVGNFNFDLLSSSSIQKRNADILSDFNFIQHITDPSRVINLSATLIAHVLTTSSVEVLKTVQTVSLSDHRCQILEADNQLLILLTIL